ncbi:hypothetical protein EDD29_5059 [Actinocorallia herbida]|uniref:EthD domain-containing protein n=1 Tax=Actinocorallia herbida TaxID=58109 RepID=A0A3N1D1Q9_9ACTN|nr:DUF4286 family protein [Actinocorallia herbida]ROO87451.1 hypothetical protein EDD29_5059 [Actinocorallia herbida]
MTKTILHVEAQPVSRDPDILAEFDRWYDEVHLPELLAIDGVVAACRYAPAEPGDPYIAHYEIEGTPAEVVARIRKAAAGDMNFSDTLVRDPLPRIQVYEIVAEQQAAPNV